MANYKTNASPNTYWLLSILFSSIVLIGNILAIKTTSIFGLLTPAGMICFPITYALGDIITEIYGFSAFRKVVITSLGMLFIFIVLMKIATALPAQCDNNICDDFNMMFALSPRLFFGTVAGYLTGELLNSKIMSILKFLLHGKVYITRSIFSTSIGIIVDSTVFNLVTFLWLMPVTQLMSFTAHQIVLKFSFCVFLSFVSKPVIVILRRVEKLDCYDNYRWFEREKAINTE